MTCLPNPRYISCQKENVTEYRIRQKNKQSLPTCIIRVTSLSDHGRFTTRSQVSDTLQHICEIRDIRFRQSIDSSYRMQSIASRSQQLSSLIWNIQCIIASVMFVIDLTRFNKIATQGAPQMAVDKEANSLSRVYSYYSKFNLRLFYV